MLLDIYENSYLLNDVSPLFEPNQFIDLQRIHRQYYQIGQDIGLYNAMRSYEISKKDFKDVLDNYKGVAMTQVQEALDVIDKDEEVLDTKSMIESLDISKEIKNVKRGEEAKIIEDAPIIKIVLIINKYNTNIRYCLFYNK